MKTFCDIKPAFSWNRAFTGLLFSVLGGAALVWATPSMGFLVNQIIARGGTADNSDQQVPIARNPDANDDPQQVQLQAQGPTDFSVQQLTPAPGGYSGWHTHPGVPVGTVVSGSFDFYDSNCQKLSCPAGRVFVESSQGVRGIVNTGSDNAELTIA